MIGQENREVERKTIAILRVLNDCAEPLGGRVIARRLSDLGIDLGKLKSFGDLLMARER